MKILRIILLFLFGSLIFGCTRRKKAPEGLAAWLEKNFPDRFQILDTRTVDPIGNLSFQVKKSIVAEKTDSLLQIEIKWDKRDPEPNISPGAIDSLFAKAKLDLADARSLFEALKTAGFSKTSVGVYKGFARILIFEEPTPTARGQCAERLKTVFSVWPDAAKYGYWLVFMEPGTFGIEFGDIVPQAFWTRSASWYDRNYLVSQVIRDLKHPFSIREIEKNWEFNLGSDRLGKLIDRARPVAEAWAAEHLETQVSILPKTGAGILRRKIGVQLVFYLAEGKPAPENAEISSYIIGDYLFDDDVLENLRIQDDGKAPHF